MQLTEWKGTEWHCSVRWEKIRKLVAETQTAATKHIITSLHYIVSVYTSTWAMTMLLAGLQKVLRPMFWRYYFTKFQTGIFNSKTATDFVTLSMGTLTAIDASCGFIFYTWRSKDFRAVIFKLLRILQNPNATSTINTATNASQRNLVSVRSWMLWQSIGQIS